MPAGATYEPISSTTVSGSSVTDITFSPIAASWTDLMVVAHIRSTRTGTSTTAIQLTFNSDTGSNYSTIMIYPDGTTFNTYAYTTSTSITEMGECPKAGENANIYALAKAHILGYAGSTYKTVLCESSANLSPSGGAGYVVRAIGTWKSTSAITSVKVVTNAGNIDVGSVVTLYGIKAA